MEKSDNQSFVDVLAGLGHVYREAAKQYETEVDTWWEALPYDDKLRAFYSVVKRIHDGDIKQQGSYRYVLYDVFGFGPDAYGIGMDCGYMSLHNAIKTAEEEQIINDYYEAKNKAFIACINKDVDGNCPLHNLHCTYPECEKT